MAVGGALGVFSLMVMPALCRLPAAGSVPVALHGVLTWGDAGSAPRLAGAVLYPSAVLLTGVVHVPANKALARIDAEDATVARQVWAEFAHSGSRPTTSGQSPRSPPELCWSDADHAGSRPMNPISLVCTSALSGTGTRAPY